MSFSGSIPQKYEGHLGPLLFTKPAEDLAQRLSKHVPAKGKVLEIASGTGISTEYIQKILPESTSITATDMSEDVLSVARQKRGDLPNVSYEVADASKLPFQDANFDAVVIQFGVMFFPDKVQCLKEIKRVLKPGGVLVFNVWDSVENNPPIKTAQETLATFFEDQKSDFFDVPFGLSDIEHVAGLLEEAGYENVESVTVPLTVEGQEPESIAKGVVEGTPILFEIQERATADTEAVEKAIADAIRAEFGQNPSIPLQEITFIAQKPLVRK